MDPFQIAGRDIGRDEPAYIIAEAGINHDGDFEQAKALVDATAGTGADAIKFQTFQARELYQDRTSSTGDDSSTLKTFETLEMPYEWIAELAGYAQERGLDFLSTPFDRASVNVLDEYVPAFKIASSALSDHRFLRRVAETGKPMICSTGIHTREEVADAITVLESVGAEFVLLHCVSAYPTPLESINVRMVQSIREWFDVPTGLSDHTEDPIVAPSAAVALGATVVEKHITTDSSRTGADHAMALEPEGFERMVTAIRQTETALGEPYEDILGMEKGAYENARRGIYAIVDIDEGETLTEDKIGVYRADGRNRGLEPSRYEDVLGHTASGSIGRFDPVAETDIAW